LYTTHSLIEITVLKDLKLIAVSGIQMTLTLSPDLENLFNSSHMYDEYWWQVTLKSLDQLIITIFCKTRVLMTLNS